MQVVWDLISYLDERGLLTREDVEFLHRSGYHPDARDALATASDMASEDEPDDNGWEPVELAEDEPGTFVRGRVLAERPKLRRRRATRPRPPRLSARRISERILAQWENWERVLEPLRRFTEPLQTAGDLISGLDAIRRTSHSDLELAVRSALESPRQIVVDLWPALSFAHFRSIVFEADKGPSAVAYRAILAAATRSDLGSYAWVLREEGISRVFLAVHAQRAVLAAFGRCFAACPMLFERRLFAPRYHEVCYWSLTIAVSALLVPGRSMGLRLHPPARPRSEGESERLAWSCAAAMNSQAIAHLLARFESNDQLRCPSIWDDGYFPSDLSMAPSPTDQGARE
jgi:hypothetical protein